MTARSPRPRHAVLRRMAAGVVLLVAALLPAATPSQAAGEASRTAKLVGKWDRITPTAVATWGAKRVVPPNFFADAKTRSDANQSYPLTGNLVANFEARQLWQLYPLDGNPDDFFGPVETGIVVFDVDTGKALGTTVLPMLRRATNVGDAGSADWVHASDGGRRLFFLSNEYEVVEVDARSLRVTKHPMGEPFSVGGRRIQAVHGGGFTFDPGTDPGPGDDAVIAFMGFSPGAMPVFTGLFRVPLNGQRPSFRIVRACNGATPNIDVGSHLQMPVLITRDRFYLACLRNGYTAVVVGLDRASAFDNPASPELEFPGPTYLETALVDRESERVFVVTTRGEIWVFDTRAGAYIGVIATVPEGVGSYTGYGIDSLTGRLFFQSDHFGLGVIEGRFFPVPQAIRAPGTVAPGFERILSDARGGRVYVLENRDDRPPFYKVYDAGEAPAPPAQPDPDRNTADIDEAPGKTESRFFASGTGFGARALLVKGISTVPPAAGAGVQTTGMVINDHVNSKCGYTDRELLAGEVSKAEYDTGSTAAAANAVEVDDRTKIDLERASRCDLTVRDTNGTERFSGIFATAPPAAQADGGPGWGRKGAGCTSSAGGAAERGAGSQDAGRPSFGPSEAVCPVPGGVLTASATAELTGPVAVGRAHTDVRIERTAKGIETVVTASAGDISVADGQIRIGEIEAEARSVSNGRPRRDPMSTHTVRMADVSVRGQSICGATCDPSFVVEQLKALNLGRVEFRTVNGRDERLLLGTPKGAQTAVQKSAARQASDRGLLGDTRAEVPAFEIVVYNDNTEYGRARQVYQFAGVASAANYNVVPTPSFADLLDNDDEPSRPDGLDLDTGSPTVSGDSASESLGAVGASSERASGGGLAGFVRRAVSAIAEGFKLLVTDPRRALLVLTAWAVLIAPAALSRRRRLLVGARA